MKFRSLIIKNIFRNKTRSFLAILIIAIGAAAVLGLGLVTDGLAASTQQALTAGAADFSVVNATSSGNDSGTRVIVTGGQAFAGGGEKYINQSKVSEIQQISGVSKAVGVLRTMASLDNSTSSSSSSSGELRQVHGFSLIGINSSDISMDDISITNGTIYSGANEVIMGATEARNSNKTVGDTITLYNQTFKIVGIYETGNVMDDRGVVMSLDQLQNLTGNTEQVSLILVKAQNGTDATNLAQTIEGKYPNELSTTQSLSGMNRMNNGLQTIQSASWAVTLLALLISGVMVVATMMKSVSDRTREIGVLKAVGWNKRRILELIIGESMIIAVIATIIGLIIGVAAVEALLGANILRGIHLAFSINLLLRAIGVSLFLGIIGGIYPAYRASRLKPTEALRYE